MMASGTASRSQTEADPNRSALRAPARTPDTLRIASYNVNEKLRTDPGGVADTLKLLDVDIAAIQDTGINSNGEQAYANQELNKRGFTILTKAHTTLTAEYTDAEIRMIHTEITTKRARGARRDTLAWIVKSPLAPICETIPSGIRNSRIQVMNAHLPNIKIALCNVYLPPPPSTGEEINEILNMIPTFIPTNIENRCILGDFNGVPNPHLDRERDGADRTPAEQATFEWCVVQGLVDTYRTTYPNERKFSFSRTGRHQSRIDQAWASVDLMQQVTQAGIYRRNGSDHEPIFFDTWSGIQRFIDDGVPRFRLTRYKIPKAKKDGSISMIWSQYQNRVTTNMAHMDLSQEIVDIATLETEANMLKQALAKALTDTFGLRKRRPDGAQAQSKAAARTRTIIRRCTRLLTTTRKNRDTASIQLQEAILRRASQLTGQRNLTWQTVYGQLRHKRETAVTQLSEIIATEKRASAKQEQAARIAELSKNSGFKRYSGKIQPKGKLRMAQRPNGDVTTNPAEVRNIVRESWNALLGEEPRCDDANRGPWAAYDQPQTEIQVNEDFTAHDISYHLRKTELNKAPDANGINGATLWHAPLRAHEALARLYRAVLRLEHIPESWRTTWVTLLYKKGAITLPSNYRPISITGFEIKMLDGIVHDRSVQPLEDSGRLDRMQFAGRPETGCQEAWGLIDQMMDYANRNKEHGQKLYIALIDFWKAYDTVHWETLFGRLHRIGLRLMAKTLRIIYQSIRITIRTGVGFTDFILQRNGIAQGMQSSPLAYIVYINCLVSWLSNRGGGYRMIPRNRLHIPHLQGAATTITNASIVDDLIIASESIEDISSAVLTTIDFGAKNSQYVSLEKTQCATNDPQGLSIAIPTQKLCPPERVINVATTNKTFMGEDEDLTYLGVTRSLKDRGSSTIPRLNSTLMTVLSHMMRKPAPPAFVTMLFNTMIVSIFTYFVPWIYIPNATIRTWQLLCNRVFRSAQHLHACTRTEVINNKRTCGIRPLKVVFQAAIADTYMRLTSTHSPIIRAFHANEVDIVYSVGNGAGATYHILQRYWALHRSLLATIQRIFETYKIRGIWSKGPLHIATGDAAFFKWSDNDTRSPNGQYTETVTERCHGPGAIAVGLHMSGQLRPTSVRQMTHPAINRIGGRPAPGTFPTRASAIANGWIDGRMHRSPHILNAWNRWRDSFCDVNHNVLGRFLLPPASDLSEYQGMIHWRDELIKIAVVPTTHFLRPPRGEYAGGAVLIWADQGQTQLFAYRASGAQSTHQTCAVGVLLTLQMTSTNQRLQISTPLDYIFQRITQWDDLPPGKQAQCKARTTLELTSMMLKGRPNTRLVTTPTNHLGIWNQYISNDLINPDPQRWWTGESGGEAREAAQRIARQQLKVPRILPDSQTPLRLLFTNVEKTENREGKLSNFILKQYDAEIDDKLSRHHAMSPYFGPNVHPMTWKAIKTSNRRSLIINAREGRLPMGDNLIAWRFHDAGSRETRCTCNWNSPVAITETLEHLLFECHENAEEAQTFRNQPMTTPKALGAMAEIIATPQNPHALHDATMEQSELIRKFILLWDNRTTRRANAHRHN
jgi:exonuclease III